MAIQAGTQLGPYEITGPLGKGGMGEVYRATDTSLNRQVAIKVLPTEFAQDTERLARFEREAKTLASLNHPNIAQIYGFEKSTGIHALVMELVEGPTLADRIAQGPIPVDEALPIAKQIAKALEAAHEQGIIHRDLKPANVKVKPDGTVKVLDFGLAKAMDPVGDASSVSMSPTLSMAATQQGIILGTAAYMSPEQARGKPVGKQADIWSFGVVLFEMLTGHQAFADEDVSMTLSKVLQREPDFDVLPPEVPSRVRQTLKVCLQKDARQRGGDMAAIRLALEGVFETTARQAVDEVDVSPPTWRQTLPVAVAGLLLGGLVVGLVARSLWPVGVPLVVNRFEYEIPADRDFGNPGRRVIALSPDGRQFVYKTLDGLYLHRRDALEAQFVPGTGGNMANPFFSPNGQSVGYFDRGSLQLKRVSIDGGAPVVISNNLALPLGATWAADDTILFGQPEGIVRVPATGGMPALVIPAQQGELLYGPQLLPDGDSVLFSATTTVNDWDAAEVVVGSLASGQRTTILEGGSEARYIPTGHLVYAFENGIFGVPFDPGRLTLGGSRVSLLQGVSRSSRSRTGAANYSVSTDGTLIYLPVFGANQTQLTWFDRNGEVLGLVGEPAEGFNNFDLTSDDARVVSQQLTGMGTNSLWITDLQRNISSILITSGSQAPVFSGDPIWSPDGDRVVFVSGAEGLVFSIPARGGDAGVVFQMSDARSSWAEDWSADGQFLALTFTGGDAEQVAVVPLEGDQTPVVIDEALDLDEPHFSPDGRWIAYNADRTGGGMEVYVAEYPPTG